MMMIAYHFCFDLNYFGLIHQDFNHEPFWLASRAIIVSLFLILVGISLVLASSLDERHFRKRQIRLFIASTAVTIGSYLMFPESYIFFGILHFIFVASLIGRLFLKYPEISLVSGIAALAAGLLYANPFFDRPYMEWMGFMTHKPYTEDYVPVFPWLGVVLVGLFLGNLLFKKWKPAWLHSDSAAMRLPALLGRHSLAIYLIHQPVLIGLLYLLWGK